MKTKHVFWIILNSLIIQKVKNVIPLITYEQRNEVRDESKNYSDDILPNKTAAVPDNTTPNIKILR